MSALKLAPFVVARDAAGLVAVCEELEFGQSIYLATGLPLPASAQASQPGGSAATTDTPTAVATALLAAFLALNDLDAARFLVKRTRAEARSPTFLALAAVAIQLWNRDYEAVHVALASPALSVAAAAKPASLDTALVHWVRDAVRDRVVALIAKAYSSIPAAQFATMIGIAPKSVAAMAESLGWRFENGFVYPVRPAPSGSTTATGAVGGLVGARPGLDRISLLADYAGQLEMLQ